jgi:ring-1,2-phenylacetyl-CoA epoxidase subunit PaaD
MAIDDATAALDYRRLAELGIGAAALRALSPVGAPTVDERHPRVRSAAVTAASLRAAAVAGSVVDPEIPVLTVADLGVLRRVEVHDDRSVEVDITPTYSGCPAVEAMASDIGRSLQDAGYPRADVRTVLWPAWSTDDMTDTAREMLQRFGIAPPGPVAAADGPITLTLAVRCPHCGSRRTRQTSRFGSTSCKAMYICDDCAEPFDHFKAL